MTPKFNKSKAEIFEGRLKQAELVNETNVDNKLKALINKFL